MRIDFSFGNLNDVLVRRANNMLESGLMYL